MLDLGRGKISGVHSVSTFVPRKLQSLSWLYRNSPFKYSGYGSSQEPKASTPDHLTHLTPFLRHFKKTEILQHFLLPHPSHGIARLKHELDALQTPGEGKWSEIFFAELTLYNIMCILLIIFNYCLHTVSSFFPTQHTSKFEEFLNLLMACIVRVAFINRNWSFLPSSMCFWDLKKKNWSQEVTRTPHFWCEKSERLAKEISRKRLPTLLCKKNSFRSKIPHLYIFTEQQHICTSSTSQHST